VKIIDLGGADRAGPNEPLPSIEHEDHAKTAPLIAQIFGCDVNFPTARAGRRRR
jgi:hypothetical protein